MTSVDSSMLEMVEIRFLLLFGWIVISATSFRPGRLSLMECRTPDKGGGNCM